MLEVLQAKSHGHLHELESNSIMIPDLQIPWIYILLEMDLQPLRLVSLVGDCSEISRSWSPTIAGTCSLWQSSRKSPTALRPSYDVRATSQWPMHDPGHQKYLRPLTISGDHSMMGPPMMVVHWSQKY